MGDVKKRLFIDLNSDDVLTLFGVADENLRLIEREFNVRISGKDNRIIIKGNKHNSEDAEKAIEKLKSVIVEGRNISRFYVEEIIEEVRNGSYQLKEDRKKIAVDFENGLLISSKRKPIRPKTKNQREYLKKIFNNQIIFAIGPAGTGKTYLAIAAGLYFLREKKVERIILVRPVVEAGENLGFLPGDLKEKIDPYLRPLFDAIYDMIEPRIFHELIQSEIIEIAPLAYMRGRTLNKAFVILDEAQNTTVDQMKMFLTRTGNDSKLVITGDITQIDLPVGKKSGLIHAKELFERSGDDMGMTFINFTAEDVSRAEIVKKILEAYDRYEKNG
ncbi:MAG: PhoH family protein [Candidatus Goldbacteria bacterium]|nr:PhoH family protein [Candidatus Goldiibacteriota bacterium]